MSLFSPKTKGYFVEKNDHAWMLARTSSNTAPFVIEDLREVPINDVEGLKTAITAVQSGKAAGNFLNATCGVYPNKRVIRKTSLELKRVKEPGYLGEVCSQQLRLEADKFTFAVLNASDGIEFDANKPMGKDVLFCGLPTDDIVTLQDTLLQSSVYPTRVELGTIASLGAAIDYLAFTNNKMPTLYLEIGSETTHSFIIGPAGVEATRPIPFGIETMIPVVHKKLSLKDEESARKLFFSNTFDFTSMGPELVQRLLKELQSSIGFYEVQTGQSISQVICTQLPAKLGWIETTVANALGVSAVKLNLSPWLQTRRVTLSEQATSVGLDNRWFGLVALMTSYQTSTAANAAPAEKKE